MAEYTREVHEEYAVQRWPETKRLLGLLVNSSGSAHARNARRLVHATRKEDRRLSAALLAAALAHTPEAEEALRGARTRMARKPAALARELLRNFPKGRRGKSRRKRRSGEEAPTVAAVAAATGGTELEETDELTAGEAGAGVDDDLDDDLEGDAEEFAAVGDADDDDADDPDDDDASDPDDDASDADEAADDTEDDDADGDDADGEPEPAPHNELDAA
jgi:hypothetical protein